MNTESNVQNQLQLTKNQVEKAFSSPYLSDVLPMITKCADFIRDCPFPSFVVEIVYRLAQLFQGDTYPKMNQYMNLVRLRIVTTINQCGSNINVPYSSDGIVQEIMKVSHSNDYKARSLTLLLLGSLSPICHNNKKVHHLLIEALDSTTHVEQLSAIYSCSELVTHSSNFASMVMNKIGGLKHFNPSLKMSLISILNNLLEEQNSSNIGHIHTAQSTIEHRAAVLNDESSFSPFLSSLFKSMPNEDSRFSLFLQSLIRNDQECLNKEMIYEKIILSIDSFQLNFWTQYLVARTSMIFGHWRGLALPILKKIHPKCDTIETSSWIEALQLISESEPLDYSSAQIKLTENNLQSAELLLKVLKSLNHGNGQHFGFASEYTGCLLSSFCSFRLALVAANLNLSTVCVPPRNECETGNFSVLMQSFSHVVDSFLNSSTQWLTLYRRSFDAGSQTHNQIKLMIRLNEDAVQIIRLLSCPSPSVPQTPSEYTFFLRKRLMDFKDAMMKMCRFPLGLPKYFFKRRWTTKIRLNVMPQPSETEQALKISKYELLPLTVEGIVESNNPNRISEVSIMLSKNNQSHERRIVKIGESETYFNTQFLLRINKVTEINVHLSFTDSMTGQTWLGDSDQVISTTIKPHEN